MFFYKFMETIKSSAFIGALLPFLVIVFIVGIGVIFLYQHFQKNLFIHKLKQETLKNVHQSDLLRSNVEAQEVERKRIAQDLHDELGAVLSIIRMNMIILERQNEKAQRDNLTQLQNIRLLSETAIASIRSISHRLMPPQLEAFGLIKTLEAVAEQVNNAGSIKIQLSLPSSLANLSWTINLGLYRIIMELINNTIKHSGATHVAIDLYTLNQEIFCRYSDNGSGLKGNNIHKGLGHKSIDARINILEGSFDAGTNSTGGFYASIVIPMSSYSKTIAK
jgi:signal transduction histidine kinase